MKIFDITRPLTSSSVVYPGDTPPKFHREDRGLYLITDMQMNSHTGTHIDAPIHYLKVGDTIDLVPLPHLIGKCRVLDVTEEGSTITETCLEGRINGIQRILLKTSFSRSTEFREDYPSLTLGAARYLTNAGLFCIGIDSFSIEAFICDGSVHRELLGHNCIIIELLDLSKVPEGDYTMIALPLRLTGLDGSPARVILTTDEVDS
ncbi:cyclase family protein [Methanoregula sp.]|uniref:cyclase family protein n=1 Tax=Methanoregula sp. TaxID=2052170 RepID=UPI00356804AB